MERNKLMPVLSCLLLAFLHCGYGWAGVLVANTSNAAVAIDGATGVRLGQFGNGATNGGITVGPDGQVNWYSDSSNVVVRRPSLTGPSSSFSVDGILRDIAYGSDGYLYATKLYTASSMSGGIVRYNASTGSFVDLFVVAGDQMVLTTTNPGSFPGSFAFGPDGNIYVNVVHQNDGSEVLRFSGITGALLDTFVPIHAGGIGSIYDLEFGLDGNLYATTNKTDSTPSGPVGVVRFDGTTGAFLDVFIEGTPFAISGPSGFTFGENQDLYLVDGAELLQFDLNGQLIQSLGNEMNYAGYFLDYLAALPDAGSVPEPASLTLLGLGLAGLALSRRKRS